MPNSNIPDTGLSEFIEEIVGEDSFRIEEDFGDGFVRLRSSEAERRQAAQDIRSSEDAVIELLRNSRDAGAENIYVATGKTGDIRTIEVIDDGSGIPESMHELIFEPRITSKLDSAHMDKWGLHGRGMALFSISENSTEHEVAYSQEGGGTSIKISLSMDQVSEKTDQSTFPTFEIEEGTMLVRGPKNIQRVAGEFAIENRDSVKVFLGSNTEILATLYHDGTKAVPAKERVFAENHRYTAPAQMLSFANTPEDFCEIASKLGFSISTRSARRVLDKEIAPLQDVFSLIKLSLISPREPADEKQIEKSPDTQKPARSTTKRKFAKTDLDDFGRSVSQAFNLLGLKYYLDSDIEPNVSVRDDKLIVTLDLIEKDFDV